MCPVTAPRRGAEWQMRDPITSHVTGKDRDQHPNLLRRGTAERLLLALTPSGLGCRCSLRRQHGGSAEPSSQARLPRRPRGSGPATSRPSGGPCRALVAPLCPPAPSPLLWPRKRPGRSPPASRPSRSLCRRPAPSQPRARPPPGWGPTGPVCRRMGARRCSTSLEAGGRGKGATNFVLLPRSCCPRTAALRGRGGAAGARQRAAPEQRLAEGCGGERLRGRRGEARRGEVRCPRRALRFGAPF